MFEHDSGAGTSRVAAGGPGFGNARSVFRLLLLLGSMSTAAVAAWLVFVTVAVLPARDPGHVALWRAVAVGCLAFSALSWASLARGSRAILRWALLAVALTAIGFGIYAILSMLTLPPGGHFEGYLVLMGLLFAGHGVAAFVYALLTMRGAAVVKSSMT